MNFKKGDLLKLKRDYPWGPYLLISEGAILEFERKIKMTDQEERLECRVFGGAIKMLVPKDEVILYRKQS